MSTIPLNLDRRTSAPAPAAEGASVVRPDWVPVESYYERRFVELEREKLWPKVWLIGCRDEEIPKVGDFVNFEIANESFLIVRTAPDEVKSFYNVCRHRGRRLKEVVAGNMAGGVVCPFHAWAWNLDGSIKRVVAPEDWQGCPNFDEGYLNLKETRIESWGGWWWISMDPEIEPLLEYLGVIPDVMKHFDLEDLRFSWYQTLHAPVNWKVVADAFNEGYHAQGTHPQVGARLPWETLSKTHGAHSQFWHPIPGAVVASPADPPKGEDAREHFHKALVQTRAMLRSLTSEHKINTAKEAMEKLPPDATIVEVITWVGQNHRRVLEEAGARWPEKLTLEDIARAGTNWHVFPNTIFLPSVDSMLWYRLRPDGDDPSSCFFDVWCLERYAPGKAPPLKREFYPTLESFKGQNPFLEQDFSNLRAVQKGVRSRSFEAARTSPVQEIAGSNFHRVLHEYYGAQDD